MDADVQNDKETYVGFVNKVRHLVHILQSQPCDMSDGEC